MIRDFLVLVFLSIPPPYQKQPILAILPFSQSAPYSNLTIPAWGVNRPPTLPQVPENSSIQEVVLPIRYRETPKA